MGNVYTTADANNANAKILESGILGLIKTCSLNFDLHFVSGIATAGADFDFVIST